MALNSDQIIWTLPVAPTSNSEPGSKVYIDQVRADLLALLQAMDPIASVRVACTTILTWPRRVPRSTVLR